MYHTLSVWDSVLDNFPRCSRNILEGPLKHILSEVQWRKKWKFIRMNIHLKIHIPRSAQGMVYLPSFGYLLKDFPTQRLDLRPTSEIAWASSLEKQAPQKFGRTTSQKKTSNYWCFYKNLPILLRFLWILQFSSGKKTRIPAFGVSFFHLKLVSPKKHLSPSLFGGFLKWWYPTTISFPTENDHFGVFWGYNHLRKHPFAPRVFQFG